MLTIIIPVKYHPFKCKQPEVSQERRERIRGFSQMLTRSEEVSVDSCLEMLTWSVDILHSNVFPLLLHSHADLQDSRIGGKNTGAEAEAVEEESSTCPPALLPANHIESD